MSYQYKKKNTTYLAQISRPAGCHTCTGLRGTETSTEATRILLTLLTFPSKHLTTVPLGHTLTCEDNPEPRNICQPPVRNYPTDTPGLTCGATIPLILFPLSP